MPKYSGQWVSGTYGWQIAYGRVVLDYEPKRRDAYEVKADIEYMGLYRLGQTTHVTVNVCGDKGGVENHVAPAHAAIQGREVPQGTGKLSFTVTKRNGNKISGTFQFYTTKLMDEGTFWIKPGPDHGEQPLNYAIKSVKSMFGW